MKKLINRFLGWLNGSPIRARTKKGYYKADNPKTKKNEAYVKGRAPKKKKKKKKKTRRK